MVRYAVKKSGYAPRIDHSIIKKLLNAGKTNGEIAEATGYSIRYVGELRFKYRPRIKYFLR